MFTSAVMVHHKVTMELIWFNQLTITTSYGALTVTCWGLQRIYSSFTLNRVMSFIQIHSHPSNGYANTASD